MKIKILLILGIVLGIQCSPEKEYQYSLLQFIPENTSAIVKINDFNAFTAELDENDLIQKLITLDLSKKISEVLVPLNYVQPSQEALISFTIDSLQTLFNQWGGCNLTGFGHEKRRHSINVYPNPTTEVIHFELIEAPTSKGVKLLIYNPKGQKIAEVQAEHKRTLSWDANNYAPGLYSYQLIIDKQAIGNGKFIVK